MKIVKILLPFFTLIFATAAQATKSGETLTAFQIENQFSEPAALTADTKYIIFSSDMDAAKNLNEYLNENISKHDLSKTLIIADISKMPTLVSKMFAIPKMKKYSYKLALDKTGETTKNWPRQKGNLVVIKLTALKIDSVETLNSKEAVAGFFKDKFAQ